MTTFPNPNTVDAVADQLREGLRDVKNRDVVNEDVTKQSLIWPVLEKLGYAAAYRIPEYSNRRNRPDNLCYLNPVAGSPGYAAIIVEAKEYDTDFDKRGSARARQETPDRQIQRYLKRHSAVGPNTIGVLTDGIRWRIYYRAGTAATPDAKFVAEYNFNPIADSEQPVLPELAASATEGLAEFVDRLSRESLTYGTNQRSIRPSPPSQGPAAGLFAALSQNPEPKEILRHLLGEPVMGEPGPQIQTDLTVDVVLQGIRQEAHDRDWESYAYAKAFVLPANPGQPALLNQGITLAVVRHHYDQEYQLNRPEVAVCARTFASADPSNTSVVLVYTVGPDGVVEARLTAAAAGQVNMTVGFDPSLASPSARAAIDKLLQRLHAPGESPSPTKLMELLEAAPLRHQFYQEVAQWTGRLQKDKDLSQRQAVLRHLVRVMFTWILKEENIIPPQLFEYAFINGRLSDADAYHHDVLRFLFHQRLNIPQDQWENHPSDAVNDAMELAPFLNGSLFADHQDDDNLDIPAARYWDTNEDDPGLFTILARYHWTMDEHRPGESEQTLDPELLSNLFERLIAPTEEGAEPLLRQPQGTYYTPSDVADEMVKDALAAAVKGHVPKDVTEPQLLELFGDDDASPPSLTAAQCRKLVQRIKELRIFDPAVGSGEFLFRTLIALQRALGKLEPDRPNPAADVINRQLSGQDIHPLAVQITRLRLFIAVTASRRHDVSSAPLPNLEARIVCADTLETNADPKWRPERPGQLDATDQELVTALIDVARNRSQWFDAHTESEKQALLTKDSELRDRLSLLLQQKGELANPELIAFAASPLFNLNPVPARTDARLLFYENPWRGFDVIIGNPPYEALSKSVNAAGRKRLAEAKSYRTTNAGDLYTLFCEAALALANPNGGVATLIVPPVYCIRAKAEIASGYIQQAMQGNQPAPLQ